MALTDAQVDATFAADLKQNGCTWLEGDRWPYARCGRDPVGNKHHCPEHYARAVVKNSALSGKRKSKQLEREIRDLEQQLAIKHMLAEAADDREDSQEILDKSPVDEVVVE